MSGLIGTGLTYEQNAMSGMIRESAEKQQMDQVNMQTAAQEKMQTEQMVGEGLGIGAMLLFAGIL